MKQMNIRHLLLSIIGCQGVGFLGSVVTFESINTWYKFLVKPAFSPPNWLFGPVWTTLYFLMGISFYLIWQKGPKNRNVQQALNLFIVHLVFNAGWSFVFFGLHSILGGMVALIILWGFIVALIREFYKIERLAAYLLVPYLLWVSLAAVLNFSLLVLNP